MIKNNASFSFTDLFSLFGSKALVGFKGNELFNGVSTDSRTLQKNNLFVPLRGDNFDGHDFLMSSFDKGAGACLCEPKYAKKILEDSPESKLILVDNTLVALGSLANFHRKQFNLPVVAVAGSNGKTTTKEMMAAVLSKKYNVLKTEKNFNNRVGVPLTLLSINITHEIAVIEIGTNQPGEISLLSKMVAPDYGVITNIGHEHLEYLHDLDGVELEETMLFTFLKKQGKTALLNMGDKRLSKYAKIMNHKFMYGDNAHSNLKTKIIAKEDLTHKIECEYGEKRFEISLSIKGKIFAMNALPAISVGILKKVEIEKVVQALEDFNPILDSVYGRMDIEERERLTIINDTYNSNPESARIALDVLRDIGSDKTKVAVLGGMRELGSAGMKAHTDLLVYAKDIADVIILLGEEFYGIDKDTEAFLSESKEDITNILKEIIQKNKKTVALFKGSRYYQLEKIIQSI